MAGSVNRVISFDDDTKFIVLDENIVPIKDETGFYAIVDNVRVELDRILLKDWFRMSRDNRAEAALSPLFLISGSYNKIVWYDFNFSSGVIRAVDSNGKEFFTEIDGLKFSVNSGTSEDLYIAGAKE